MCILELAKIVVTEMVERSGIKPKDIQQVVYGQVAPSVQMPNIAREIVLGTGLPQTIDDIGTAIVQEQGGLPVPR